MQSGLSRATHFDGQGGTGTSVDIKIHVKNPDADSDTGRRSELVAFMEPRRSNPSIKYLKAFRYITFATSKC
jgi:hypothetical protein